jgi:hypothetical protein
MTGELALARHVPRAAILNGNQDHIGQRCIADSGFDIQSDVLLAILTSSRTVRKRSSSRIARERRKAIAKNIPTTPVHKIGDVRAVLPVRVLRQS